MRYALFALLFLCSCQQKAKHWDVENVETGNPQHRSARLSTLSSSLTLQWVRSNEDLTLYLEADSRPFEMENEEKTCELRILQDNEEPYTLSAYWHAGGYRLKIPKEHHDFFLKTLEKEQDLIIQVKGHEARIIGKGFKKQFAKLFYKAPFPMPVQFSF